MLLLDAVLVNKTLRAVFAQWKLFNGFSFQHVVNERLRVI